MPRPRLLLSLNQLLVVNLLRLHQRPPRPNSHLPQMYSLRIWRVSLRKMRRLIPKWTQESSLRPRNPPIRHLLNP